jgi:hypothetical protein
MGFQNQKTCIKFNKEIRNRLVIISERSISRYKWQRQDILSILKFSPLLKTPFTTSRDPCRKLIHFYKGPIFRSLSASLDSWG